MAFNPSFQVRPKMLRQLKAIEQTTGFLNAVRLRPEWIADVKEQTQVREALASVQIEGNSLTLEQAFALSKELPDRDLRDSEREFCNYLRAFDAISELRGQRETTLSVGDLLNLHRIIVAGARGGGRFAGQLRRENVSVGDRHQGQTVVHHQPPDWTRVQPELEALFEWIEASKVMGEGLDDPWVHAVIQAGIVHHRLTWIHPFIDGNGRSARMFTTLILFQRGYDFQYLFELSDYYNRARDAYYNALRQVDQSGDYTEWLVYFLGGFANQMWGIRERAIGAAMPRALFSV